MQRAREDRALEVWVGGGRELAGWLTSHKNIPMSVKDILVGGARVDEFGEVVEEFRGFDLTPVHYVVADVDLLRYGKEWFDGLVPAYALPTKMISAQTQYVWRVLRLDQADYDWLFDHPDFEPVDTAKDRDHLASESALLREDTLDALVYASFDRSASTYSGFTSNVKADSKA
ncbi:hypothetical protein IVB12_15895 [Bradyrhizobium sp. 179]|uniref:hypothetical protein n=1 Tax=Bradyrhizobium sp. 179 TaxID=2782648 RepID=UPI001FF84E80|nr:hypothetical protein [Bradyrhizobium sp. 179]MCK1543399.1 hypothetical protein [Bradyrhizobium sp. 179]